MLAPTILLLGLHSAHKVSLLSNRGTCLQFFGQTMISDELFIYTVHLVPPKVKVMVENVELHGVWTSIPVHLWTLWTPKQETQNKSVCLKDSLEILEVSICLTEAAHPSKSLPYFLPICNLRHFLLKCLRHVHLRTGFKTGLFCCWSWMMGLLWILQVSDSIVFTCSE